MTVELSRTSALAARHIALGSGLEDWNGMGTAWSYSSDPNDEHDAIREAAGLFDMSPLKKVRISGTDAAAVIDHAVSRDIARVGPGASSYLSVLTEQGTVCDDAIVANLGDGTWLFVHGSGESMERLQESGAGKSVSIELDDDLHDISFQGPKALGILNEHAASDLSALKYFEHMETELFGRRCRVSRTGYSGERGYEIFAPAADIGPLWDALLEEGASAGVMPCSFASLDKVRIEAGLLFFGYDMTTANTPWEVGLGFTISRTKGDYRGKAAALASEGKEAVKNVGLVIDHSDMVAGGETLRLDGANVGVVNSPAYSHRLGKSLALAHVAPNTAAAGTALEAVGDGVTYTAVVHDLPFIDPQKSKTHA